MFKINNRNNRARCEICSKLTINIPERHHWCRSENPRDSLQQLQESSLKIGTCTRFNVFG